MILLARVWRIMTKRRIMHGILTKFTPSLLRRPAHTRADQTTTQTKVSPSPSPRPRRTFLFPPPCPPPAASSLPS